MRSFYVKHERVFAPIEGPSMTREEFADECDINQIMRKYEKHGVITHVARSQPRYVDFADAPDFQSAMNQLIEAEAAFMTLPARVRKEFDNDPTLFVEYASDPDNLEQMREWGLAPPEKAPDAPMRVEVVNAPETKPGDGEPGKGS